MRLLQPRLMLVLWGGLALIAGTVSVVARGDDSEGGLTVVRAPGEPAPTLAPDLKARGRGAVESSAELAHIVGDTEFVVTDDRLMSTLEPSRAVTLTLILDSPISSSGPWKFLSCRGTRQVTQEFEWTNVSVLTATVDSSGHFLELAPGRAPDPKAPGSGRWIGDDAKPNPVPGVEPPTTIWELATGAELWSSSGGESLADLPSAARCPAGFNDD